MGQHVSFFLLLLVLWCLEPSSALISLLGVSGPFTLSVFRARAARAPDRPTQRPPGRCWESPFQGGCSSGASSLRGVAVPADSHRLRAERPVLGGHQVLGGHWIPGPETTRQAPAPARPRAAGPAPPCRSRSLCPWCLAHHWGLQFSYEHINKKTQIPKITLYP